jgi:predicted type IV restriction endonuclease
MVVESEKLQAALAKVRTSILLDYGELFGSEERCRQRVIDPILSALGWDIFSDEVVVEHPLPSSGKGAPPALDYVLYEVLPWGSSPVQ